MNQPIKFIGRPAGRCATIYERDDLDQVLPRFKSFVYRDQNSGLPTKLEMRKNDVKVNRFQNALGYGIYGVEPDGSLTLLSSMIDSSD